MGDNSDVGKIFVGGISRDTNDATLVHYFSKYGDVSSSVVAIDRVTGLSRGFAFVTFSNPSSIQLALLDSPHCIAGRTVEVKKALPRHEQQFNAPPQQQRTAQRNQPNQTYTSKVSLTNNNNCSSYGASNIDQSKTKKIFVGGLSANVTEMEFKNYFEKFGRITDVVVMHDNTTNRPRGFGFITFDSEEVVEKLMQKSHHELGGKHIEVKKAIPREVTNFNANRNNPRFGGSRFSPSPIYLDDGNRVTGPGPVPYVNYPGQYPYPGYYFGGRYPGFGGYGVFGYGMTVVPPRAPLNGIGMMGVRPLPYGTGYYPTGVNGGVTFVGMINGYNGVVDTTRVHNHQMNGLSLDVDNSSLRVDKGVVNGKKNSKVAFVGRSS